MSSDRWQAIQRGSGAGVQLRGRVPEHGTEVRAGAGARRYITLSRAFAGLLERDFAIDPDLIRIVPGGVDCARFRPSPPSPTA